jgi:hypothetical protein
LGGHQPHGNGDAQRDDLRVDHERERVGDPLGQRLADGLVGDGRRAEVEPDGTFVVTKHPGTGGQVSIGTVTAQLLYEIAGPEYANPDAVARFDTIRLEAAGPDRVRVSGVRGEPPSGELKLCINYAGGFRNSMSLLVTGLDAREKAALVERSLRARFSGSREPRELHFQLDEAAWPDPDSNERATARLRITAKDPDERKVGRAFSNAGPPARAIRRSSGRSDGGGSEKQERHLCRAGTGDRAELHILVPYAEAARHAFVDNGFDYRLFDHPSSDQARPMPGR